MMSQRIKSGIACCAVCGRSLADFRWAGLAATCEFCWANVPLDSPLRKATHGFPNKFPNPPCPHCGEPMRFMARGPYRHTWHCPQTDEEQFPRDYSYDDADLLNRLLKEAWDGGFQ